jgi:response regulator RpfG family c-di-GMP phosphodiesterase
MASNNKIQSLIYTMDLALVKSMQAETKGFSAELTWVPCSTLEKLTEYLNKTEFDLIIIDEKFFDSKDAEYLKKLKENIKDLPKNQQIPCFLLTNELDFQSLKGVMKFGFKDVFTKPVDFSLFYQKIQMYCPKVKFINDKLLFTMNVKSEIDIGMTYNLVKVSEFGIAVQSQKQFQPGEQITLYGDLFKEKNIGAVLAQVQSSTSVPNKNGEYETQLIFIGPSKELVTGVRLWIKKEYLNSIKD